ncbi:MAG: hypothetical protein R3Y59_02890 [bacterium]
MACICKKAKATKVAVIPIEDASTFSLMAVTDDGACIALTCNECDQKNYIRIDYCPYCGEKLLTNKD